MGKISLKTKCITVYVAIHDNHSVINVAFIEKLYDSLNKYEA